MGSAGFRLPTIGRGGGVGAATRNTKHSEVVCRVYDPFAEALQNAMDAVDKRKRIETGAYEPHLWISIDLRQNQLSVTDNGCGFYEEEFKTFLCPNVSFKDGETTRGRKGVGATYLAYGFNFLQLGTKSPGYQQLAEIRDGRQWIEVNSNPNARPQVTESANPPSVFGEIDRARRSRSNSQDRTVGPGSGMDSCDYRRAMGHRLSSQDTPRANTISLVSRAAHCL